MYQDMYPKSGIPKVGYVKLSKVEIQIVGRNTYEYDRVYCKNNTLPKMVV